MIEPTDEMVAAFLAEARPSRLWAEGDPDWRAGLAAVLAIVDRDYLAVRKPTPEERSARPKPKRRLRACVENWPDADDGLYDPACCRWPKSCSATVYDEATVTDDQLEPPP